MPAKRFFQPGRFIHELTSPPPRIILNSGNSFLIYPIMEKAHKETLGTLWPKLHYVSPITVSTALAIAQPPWRCWRSSPRRAALSLPWIIPTRRDLAWLSLPEGRLSFSGGRHP